MEGQVETDIMEAMRHAHGATFQRIIRARRPVIMARLTGQPPVVAAAPVATTTVTAPPNPDDPDAGKTSQQLMDELRSKFGVEFDTDGNSLSRRRLDVTLFSDA